MTANPPLVSIIIPTYNSASFLPETLESIFAQSYPNFEIVMVDDGSSDDTPEVVSRYESRIRYFRQENSGGPARPRNVAIKHARGDYICIFDSDDLMMPDKLAGSMEFFRACPEVGMLFTNFTKFDERGPMSGTHLDGYSNFWKLPKQQLGENQYRIESAVAFDALFHGNYIGTSSVVIPASVLRAIGPFDEEVTSGGLEDRDMWFRIARRYDLGFVDVVGHKYRVHPGGVSKRAMSSAEARIKVIRRYMDQALLDSTKRAARSVIAECLCTLGYQQQLNGEFGSARDCFRRSFSEQPNLSAVRGLAITLLGKRLMSLPRYLRRRI